jgi:glycosyltransferase involved in cell wall biosynthesis
VRVLLTVGIFPPDIGGPATHIPKVAKKLREHGDLVTVIALKPSHTIEYNFQFNLRLIKRRNIGFRFITTAGSIFFQAVKSDKIYSNGLYLESALPIRILKKPAVAKIVGDPIWERERNKNRTNLTMIDFQSRKLTLKNRAMRAFYRYALNSYSCITCPSMELVEVIKGWGIKSEVKFIPNGVETPLLIGPKKEFDLIYVGRLVRWKNLDKVIYISAKLNLKTLFVGSGPENQELRFQAARLGAPCFFVGEQPKEMVQKYLESSKMFILISDYEGQSFALLEAFALGIPAIVSNVSGNLATATNSVDSLVVATEDLDTYLPDIDKLLKNDERIQFLGQKAREKISMAFSEEIILNEITELIRSSK